MAFLSRSLKAVAALSAPLWAPWLHASAQLYNPAVLDFTTFVGDVRVELLADVIRGFVNLEAPIPTDKIKDLEPYVASTLADICDTMVNVIVRIYQEIDTFQEVRISLKAMYYLLPADRDSEACAKGLQPDGSDTFKQLLAWRIKVDPVNSPGWDAEEWGMAIEPAVVERRQVKYPERLPRPVLSATPPGPLDYFLPPDNGLGGGGDGNGGGNFSAEDDPRCKWATSACVCATTQSCTWAFFQGSFRCMGSPLPTDIPCTKCNLQSGCDLSQTEACFLQKEPCSCALSASLCRWDLSTMTCVPAQGLGTSCSVCSQQVTCDPPELESVLPASGSTFGATFNRQVTVTFDRPVRLEKLADGVLYQCTDAPEQTSVPSNSLALQDKVLTVQIADVPRETAASCSLALAEGVVKDDDDQSFLGTGDNWYTFFLQDTIGPRPIDYSPTNGAEDIVPGVPAILVFNEPISVKPSCEVTLYATGIAVHRFILGSSAVTFSQDRQEMMVALGDHVKRSETYSLRLPPECVKDDSGNWYDGLPEGVYIFHTESERFTVDESKEPFSVIVIGAASAAAVMVLLITCTVVLCRFRGARQAFASRLHAQESRMRRWSSSSLEGVWNEFSHQATRARRFSLETFAITGGTGDRKVRPESETKTAAVAVRPAVEMLPPRSQAIATSPSAPQPTVLKYHPSQGLRSAADAGRSPRALYAR